MLLVSYFSLLLLLFLFNDKNRVTIITQSNVKENPTGENETRYTKLTHKKIELLLFAKYFVNFVTEFKITLLLEK